jgi:hypothetical protein
MVYLGVFRYIWVYLGVFGYIWVYLGKRSRRKENTEKENRMLNWVIWAGHGLETSVIVGMSSDQFYEWKRTLKWRKYVWTGECNVYILTMKINRTMWLIGVINLFRRWIHRRKYIFIYHLYLKCILFTSK